MEKREEQRDGSGTAGTAELLIFASETGRKRVFIVNNGNLPLYVKLRGRAAAAADTGIRLNPLGGSVEIRGSDWKGAITCVAGGACSFTAQETYDY